MKKNTIAKIIEQKNKQPITMLTAYSYPMAKILSQTNIDMLLVGDSLGMVFQGNENTLSVTVEEMIYHGKAVRRGAPETFIVLDMPFMSYQVNSEQTLINAGKIIKETNANAVKVEGATDTVLDAVAKINKAGIPVMGHLGFTPQALNKLSGYKIQGKTDPEAIKIIDDAQKLEQAGAFAIVLEMIPAKLAGEITKKLSIPIISCGAGSDCDGQVLVIDDILGLSDHCPKFAKQYKDIQQEITTAIKQYIKDVQEKKFPDKEHSF